MLSRVKKNDVVIVTSGKDKGKQGQVIAVDPKRDTVLVKGIRVVTRHVKARTNREQNKIVHEEASMPLCKVMPVCPSCKKACRVQVRIAEGAPKARICNRCKEAF